MYERLTPPEQIADIETAKFIEEGKEIFHSPDKTTINGAGRASDFLTPGLKPQLSVNAS